MRSGVALKSRFTRRASRNVGLSPSCQFTELMRGISVSLSAAEALKVRPRAAMIFCST
jgi:hypothetical protein